MLIFWIAIAVVIAATIGGSVYRKLHAYNSRHHAVEFDDDSVYCTEDDEDDC